MNKATVKKLVCQALGTVMVCAGPGVALAQDLDIDPIAMQTLAKMTEFMSELEGFSVHTQNTLEYVMDSGHRLDRDVAANVLVRRPNKLLSHRVGDDVEQAFYYDGQVLTLHMQSPGVNAYATTGAPANIEETLDFARESLDLTIPVADLVYRNAQAILMDGVVFAEVVGEVTIGENRCTHLAFRHTDVDFQVWVSVGEVPLPCKYVVTDISTPALLSIVSVMSDWNLAPEAEDSLFEYVPSGGAQAVEFLSLANDSDR